jgi:xanthine dehydrogenase molybdopterin-binding subunit B
MEHRWVAAIVTAEDVLGKPTYGLISSDQPVFASEFVRYVGEPIAPSPRIIPETCRRALEAIVVEYEILAPLTDPERRSTAAIRRSTLPAT